MSLTRMSVVQAKPLIDAVLANLNGGTVSMAANVEDYVSAASRVNSHDPDQVMGAITQLWGRTIFAVRPYSSMLKPLVFDSDAWAMAERKINFVSQLPSYNDAWKYPVTADATQATNPTGDGLSVDMYKIRKDKVYETAFYGAQTWDTSRTTFRNQLRPAFRDPEDLVRFNAAAVQHVQNDRETWTEAYIRGLLNAAIMAAAKEEVHVVHLLTEYMDDADINLDSTDQILGVPENYQNFVRWMYGRLSKIKALMAERNTLYTTQPADLPSGMGILRHTPADRLRMLVNQGYVEAMRARVLSNTYHPELLNIGDITPVNYWLNPGEPLTAISGSGVTDRASNVVGVMFDRDAFGVMPTEDRAYSTPFNADGEYYNTFWKTLWKNRRDLSEKFVVLMLD